MLSTVTAMAPCERCGIGKRSGNGTGWCSNADCRKEERAEKLAEKLRSTPVRQRELVSEDLAQGKEADHKTKQHKPADRRAKKSARRRELVSEDLAQELEADHRTKQHKRADRRAKTSARRRELASEDLAQEKGLVADQGTRRR